jgi:hypothetical protein
VNVIQKARKMQAYTRGLISLWLYTEKKAMGLKKFIYSTYSPELHFVVLTSLTHPRKILLVVLQIKKTGNRKS